MFNKSLKKENQELQNTIEDLRKIIHDRDEEIRILNLNQNDLNRKLNNAEDMLSNAYKEIKQLESKIGDIESIRIKIKSELELQSASIEQTAATAQELNEGMQEIKNTVIKSNVSNQKNVKIVADFHGSIQDLKYRINILIRSVSEIKKIITVINNVSQQTNILALNARIEASKAGEAGKGFSVIATEVKKLSENVSGNSKTINKILGELDSTINLIEDKMSNIAASTEEFKHDTEARTKNISNILDTVEEKALSIEDLTSLIQQEAEELQRIFIMVK